VDREPALSFDPIARARQHWLDHGWADAADGMAALTSVMRVQQVLLGRVEAVLKPLGLTFARYELLALLSFTRTGALPLGKIGVRLQVHAASVTNAVDRLEAEGLVERVPHPDDGRITLARITRTGRRRAARATALLNEHVFGDIGLPPNESKLLFDLLAGIREHAGDFPPGG
jgi:DNA-binding MarR family transcriptional regulator